MTGHPHSQPKDEPVRQHTPTRQYYYRMDGCVAHHNGAPDCICWHNEGTGPLADQPGRVFNWRPSYASLKARNEAMEAALRLAEDVLSRAPFSTGMWPNGMHPQTGIEIIRSALPPIPGEVGHD